MAWENIWKCWCSTPMKSKTSLQAGGSLDDDLQYLMVLDANNNRLETLMAERTENPVWTQLTFDLQKYAGQTIKLHFGVYNDGYGGSSAMYVDDADLVICR